MEHLLPLFSIVVAIALGAISPGPSFVLVARTAIAGSRGAGLGTALGMGLGGLTFATLALLGLIALLAQVAWLYLGLKILGGLYLLYLGWRLWRGAREPLAVDTSGQAGQGAGQGFWRAALLGLVTQLSNPKTAVVYAGIFAALLPAQPLPLWLAVTLPAAIFTVEFVWYALVATAFSAGGPRRLYLGGKTWIDRLAGGVMAALGLRLVFEGARG
ncbi:LysE family translocator [Ferrovibrio terrae]|uniref:LysE family translocator n=1 Tax=Ferrovibrio terrae TaxID=2594003 RepID=A0A516H136_9PROT|nr:LysE family translocator [Ferrovibrio terrae]QDO97501.1 LysE family translocator [Ferrovibrio terrae]